MSDTADSSRQAGRKFNVPDGEAPTTSAYDGLPQSKAELSELIQQIVERQIDQKTKDSVSDNSEDKSNDILEYEKKRRDWLFNCVAYVIAVSVLLYIILLIWIFFKTNTENAWHTTIALAVTPTTLTIITLKLLSKSETRDDNKNEDSKVTNAAIDLVSKLANIINRTQP